MAVPSSGELSLLGIRREVSGNNYNSSTNYTNVSLANLSDGNEATINTDNDVLDLMVLLHITCLNFTITTTIYLLEPLL